MRHVGLTGDGRIDRRVFTCTVPLGNQSDLSDTIEETVAAPTMPATVSSIVGIGQPTSIKLPGTSSA